MSDADRKRFAAPVHGGDEITAATRPDNGDRPPKRQRANASESVTGSETTRGGSSTILGSDHVEERTEAAGASIGLPSQEQSHLQPALAPGATLQGNPAIGGMSFQQGVGIAPAGLAGVNMMSLNYPYMLGTMGSVQLPQGFPGRMPNVMVNDPRTGLHQHLQLFGGIPNTAPSSSYANILGLQFNQGVQNMNHHNIMGLSGAATVPLPPNSQPSVARRRQADTGAKPQPEASVTGRPPVLLYMTCDDDSLSEYQCVVRKQIELFEAVKEDADSNAQGRNRPIVLGQVGIRCKHCTMLPPKHRARGAIYYPARLQGLYQAAQNMASSHLCEHCQHVPPAVRAELTNLRDRKSSAGGGKKYWADGVRVLGVYEDSDGLRFDAR